MKDYTDVINDLNAGITASTLTAVVCEAASRVLTNEKAAEVTLTLKLKPLKGTQNQLQIESIIKNKMPTAKRRQERNRRRRDCFVRQCQRRNEHRPRQRRRTARHEPHERIRSQQWKTSTPSSTAAKSSPTT